MKKWISIFAILWATAAHAVFWDLHVEGDWNPNTNVPKLQSGQGQPGLAYRVSTNGTFCLNSICQWIQNDLIYFDHNQTWNRLLGSGAGTTAVFGLAGFQATDNFPGATSSASVIGVLGSAGTPDTTNNPIAIFQKWGGSFSVGTNPALYSSAYKLSNLPQARVQAGYFEAQDNAGWNGTGQNNFFEGIRAQATTNNGVLRASPYAGVFSAGEGTGATHTYMIGTEAEVINNSTDATTTFNPNGYVASFTATNSGVKRADAAFTVSPYNSAQYINGYYVPQAVGPAGLGTLVSSAAFRTDAFSTYGLYITNTSFAAIRIPNNQPILGSNSTFTSDLNLMYVDTSNRLIIGGGITAGVQLVFRDASGTVIGQKEAIVGAANSAGAGFRTVMTPN